MQARGHSSGAPVRRLAPNYIWAHPAWQRVFEVAAEWRNQPSVRGGIFRRFLLWRVPNKAWRFLVPRDAIPGCRARVEFELKVKCRSAEGVSCRELAAWYLRSTPDAMVGRRGRSRVLSRASDWLEEFAFLRIVGWRTLEGRE